MNIFKFSNRHRNFGLALLRVGIGIMFMFHGWPKLAGGEEMWEAVGGAMGNFGISAGHTFWGLTASAVEFFGGLFLILGLFFRPVCFLLLITMIVATTHHIVADKDYTTSFHAVELGIVFLAMLVAGPGSDSLDARLFNKKKDLYE